MTKKLSWILGGTALALVAGLILALPTLAQAAEWGPRSFMGMMNGAAMEKMHQSMMKSGGRMHGMMGGDMAAMHAAMAPLMAQMPAMHEQVMGAVAQKLGLTLAELEAAMAEGKSLATLATEKGVDLAELQGVMTAGMRSLLDAAVEAGTITREQADTMIQMHTEHSASCATGQGGSMMGMHKMMMGAPKGR